MKKRLPLVLWSLLFLAAALVTAILIAQRHGAFMSDVLIWTRHTNHLNEVGRAGHFEQLSSELMWRFVFHALAIGWCVATAVGYWFASRRATANEQLSVSDTVARAYARNPLAFISPANLIASSPEIGAMRSIARGLLEKSGLLGGGQAATPAKRDVDWRKEPLMWLKSGGAQRYIAVVGIAGFFVQFLIYVVFVRPSL